MKTGTMLGWMIGLGAVAFACAPALAADATLASGKATKRVTSSTSRASSSWSSDGTGTVHASVMVKTIGPDGKETVVYKSTDSGAPAGSGARAGKSPRLGVSAQPIDDTLRSQLSLNAGVGLVVSSVLPDSPAQKAGLKTHDVLVKLDDQHLMTTSQLRDLVRAHKAGDSVTVAYIRAGKQETAKAIIEEAEELSAGQAIDLGTFKIDLQEMLKNLPDEHRDVILHGLGSMTNSSGRVARRITLGGTPHIFCTPNIVNSNGTITIDMNNLMQGNDGSGTVVIQAEANVDEEDAGEKDEQEKEAGK